MRTFGGYLGLDTPAPGRGWRPGADDHWYASGRAALAAIVRHVRPARVHVPAYICSSVLAAVRDGGAEPVFHAIGEDLLPARVPDPQGSDMVLLVDYFGVRTPMVHALAASLGEHAILDRAHSCFTAPPPQSWSFDSLRKYFGVPDGARVHAPRPIEPPHDRNERYVLDHLVLAHAGAQHEGLAAYRRNNALMSTAPHRMSLVSELLLANTNVDAVRERRTANFKVLHTAFGHRNRLRLDPSEVTGPLHYPLLLERPVDHGRWHAAGIFTPRYWPEVLERCAPGSIEHGLVDRLVALPIDQRYGTEDMNELACRLEPLI